jgi:hypothetical protein
MAARDEDMRRQWVVFHPHFLDGCVRIAHRVRPVPWGQCPDGIGRLSRARGMLRLPRTREQLLLARFVGIATELFASQRRRFFRSRLTSVAPRRYGSTRISPALKLDLLET